MLDGLLVRRPSGLEHVLDQIYATARAVELVPEYEGEDTDRVRAPMPLGRMGRRLAEIAAGKVQHRSIDLYARLAAVAR